MSVRLVSPSPQQAAQKFNTDPAEGLAMLKSQGIIADDSPEEIARIFHTVEGLSKVTTPTL